MLCMCSMWVSFDTVHSVCVCVCVCVCVSVVIFNLHNLTQVKFVIDEAVSLDNLCQLYEGWTPWV